MGTKITALPQVVTPVGADELPISQDTGSGSRTTYKATLDQLKDYIKTAGEGTGTITSIGITSTDGSIGVFNSPVTSSGTISLTISSVGLNKLDDGGATGGEVLTYNASTGEWTPGFGGSSGIIPNILVGNGGTTYTLTNYTNDTESNYLVFVGGVAQRPVTDFNISGSSIIFGSTIPSGAQILVYSVINIATLNLDATPIGTVSWFAASAAPTSYLECSGGVVPISDYTDLWYVIGTKFNRGGEGAGNFRIPDLRGEFIRGWDHGRNINTGRVFGSNESDELKTHTHKVSGTVGTNSLSTSPIVVKMESYESTEVTSTYDSAISTGGSETRPRNVALLPCIKAQKTVTGNVNTLNFIEKPASPTNGQVLTYNGSTATWVASAVPKELPQTATTGQVLTYNGSTSTWVASAGIGQSSVLKVGTAVTLTNQTNVDFVGIPSWTKRITLSFSGVSTNGSSLPIIQLGSATIHTSNYKGSGWCGAGNAVNNTIGFNITNSVINTDVFHGIVTFVNVTNNIWAAQVSGGFETIYLLLGGGSVVLPGVLDRLRFTTVNGTDQFDAGIVNIMWE